jgi:hypothetical protein
MVGDALGASGDELHSVMKVRTYPQHGDHSARYRMHETYRRGWAWSYPR